MTTVSFVINPDKSIKIVDSGYNSTPEDQLSINLAVKGIYLTDCTEGIYHVNLCIHNYRKELGEIIQAPHRMLVYNDKKEEIVQLPTKNMLGQEYFLKREKEIKETTGCNYWLPIIHLCEVDIFNEPSKILNRYAFVMDNSIWNYFLSYNTSDIDTSIKRVNKEKLRYILSDIVRNYSLYYLNIAKEYAELNARLVSVSFPGVGHGLVIPFIFHSEQKSQAALESLQLDTKSQSLYKQIINEDTKWRILLVDDKATVFGIDKPYPLSTVDNQIRSIGVFKKDIIIDRLVDLGFPRDNIDCIIFPQGSEESIIESLEGRIKSQEDRLLLEDSEDTKKGISSHIEDDKQLLSELKKEQKYCDAVRKRSKQIEIWCASNIHDALQAMKEFEFEIILLDYLLDVPRWRESGTEYGYEIFEQLRDPNSEKGIEECYKLGPSGRLFFMFISAFTMAVNERLLAENISRSEKFWFIAEGACPTNTPKLFNYHLSKLFIKRLNDSGIIMLSSNEIFGLINKIYLPKERDTRGDPVRKRANALYRKVLSLQYHYRKILKDVEIPFGQNTSVFDTKGSVLMTNFIQKKINLGGMLEHLTQLVHLTAFGTVRQWPEMWEEYIYFKALFEKQLDGVSDNDFGNLCMNIENYIIKLKSQQQ